MRTLVLAPTYNECENIERFLRGVRAAAPSADVLVIDDDSPDGTAVIANRVGRELGQVEVLERRGKRGLGGAYREGFARAIDRDYDTVVSMDVDFSHDPSAIPQLLAAIDRGADVALGSRDVPGGRTENWPGHRVLLSRWGNRYTGAMLRTGVADSTSGFRAYSVNALKAIDPSSTAAEGYAFLTELVRKLHVHGFALQEVPITFRDREYGSSKMSPHIIVESMLLVTSWGFRDIAARIGARLGVRR